MTRSAAFLAVDLGKTSCRVAVGRDPSSGELVSFVGPGAVGLAEPDGAEEALRAVTALLDDGLRARLAGADACVASAGYLPGPWSEDVALLFADELGLASCAVTSDALAAHVGALGGAPGAVLAAGTGSVAVGVSADGEVHQVDGVGQWLGDDGSGAWIGLEGLRAALRSRDGRGPRTVLEQLASEHYGDLGALPRTLNGTGNVARAAAAFAGPVCSASAEDAAAAGIMDAAAAALARTAVAAAGRAGATEVALVGGLQELGPRLVDPWRAAVEAAGIAVVPPLGSTLDGAAALAVDRTLPHERAVTRVNGPRGT